MSDFSVAVVGRGLIGSAAARHLTEAGISVALIGSGEPDDYARSEGPFSSHYDSGRITRISSASPIWAELAFRSIQRYADIEQRSGLSFHDPRGLAQVSNHTQLSIDHAVERGSNARRVDRMWLRETTGIEIRTNHPGEIFYEEAPAGLINPRTLLTAQTLLARQSGATIINAPVTAIRPSPGGFHIEAGSALTADQVILATGAYGAALVGVSLAIQRRLRTIVLAELGPAPEIPSLIDDDPEHSDLEEIYWVPPVEFPDGRTMLKIGGNSLPMITADNDQDIVSWFRAGGSETEAVPLQETIRALLPDATITSWDHKPCVVTYTEPEVPFLGFVDDGVVVALGASGSGAKSSDELGRLAASLLMPDKWADTELPLDAFMPQLDR